MFENKKIKIFLVIVLMLLIGALAAVCFLLKKERDKNNVHQLLNSQNKAPVESIEKSDKKESPAEKVRSSVEGSREIFGVISEISDPAGGNVRFLKVGADVVDTSKLDNIDYAQGSSELPMTRKEFKIAVDKETEIKNGAMSDLKPGDFIKALSPGDVYGVQDFTALVVEVFNANSN